MDKGVTIMISPLEMIGLAELCDRAGDRSFAILMVECAYSVLSNNDACEDVATTTGRPGRSCRTFSADTE